MNTPPSLRALAVLAALSSSLPVFAQQNTAPTSLEKNDDETVTLSPFTVSTEKDTGYMATDVMSGGMLATNLLKTATDVTVLTREFLDDVGIVDMQSAQIWLNGSDPAGNTVNNTNPTDFGNAVSTRGLPGSNNTRNYFRQDFSPQNYVVERIEGSRGPNGIIYGDATIGGKTNFVTKRARFQNFGTVKLRLDSKGEPFGRAVELDLNRKLTDRWAVRLNGQLRKSAQWYDHSIDDAKGGRVAVTYKPWRGTEIRFEADNERLTRTNYRPDITDNSSLWDRTTTTNGPLSANPASSTGMARLTADTWTYVPGVGVQNFRNFGQSRGTGLSMFDDLQEQRDTIARFPVLPSREFNPNSANEKMIQHQINRNLTIEKVFDSGLTIEAAGDYAAAIRTGDTLYMSNSLIDVDRLLPNGQANPNFGKTYSSTNGWNPVRTGSYASAARLAAGYRLPFKKFTQTVSVVASYRERLDAFKAWQYFRENGALAPNGTIDNNQRVFLRSYWDNPARDLDLPTNEGNNTYRWVMSRDQHNRSQLRSIQANTVGSYFNDRVTLVAGIRADDFHATTRDIKRRDPVTGDVIEAGGIWVDTNATTPQLGLTVFPIEQIGVYAYQSDGFNPSVINTRKLDDSSPYNLAVSRGKGAGLRFNLFERRVVGSIGYYDTFEKDRFTQQSLSQINNVWERLYDAGFADGLNRRIPQLGGLAQYTDATTVRGWGWEADFTANLTKSLRLTFNGSLPKTKQLNSLPDTKAYYAANIATWNQYRSSSGVASALATLENQISGFVDGRPTNGLYRYRANIFAHYTVQSGQLKNVRLGLGANFFGQQIIGNVTGKSFEFIYGDEYTLTTATLGYGRKIYGYPVDFNLSVSNLLNYQEPVFRSGGVSSVSISGTTRQFRSGYYWPVPRELNLAVTVKF